MMPAAAAEPLLAFSLNAGMDHATVPGLVICGVLAVLSVIFWSVVLSKALLVGRSRRANAVFLRAFRGGPHPLAVFQQPEHFDDAPLYHIYHSASRELAFHLLGTEEPDATFTTRLLGAGRITASQMNAVREATARATGEAVFRLESRLAGLGALLAFAPWLGLMGTIWSVMDLFGQGGDPMGALTLTPQLSGILLPLLAGLLVAAPGRLALSLLAVRIRDLVVRLQHFSSEFGGILDRHFVDHRPLPAELPSMAALRQPAMPAFGGSQPLAKGPRFTAVEA